MQLAISCQSRIIRGKHQILTTKKICTCKSSFHPSSCRRVFFDISSIAHIATSAALPCSSHSHEIRETERAGKGKLKWKGKNGRTCTGVLIAARSTWPLREELASVNEGKTRARPSNVWTRPSSLASFLRACCHLSTSFLSLYQRLTVSFASATETWKNRW